MPESFEIYSFLVGNRAEVKTLFLTEFDEEEMKRQEREEGYDEGHTDGIEDTLQFLIKTGKRCKKDADEARSSIDDKRQNTVIV